MGSDKNKLIKYEYMEGISLQGATQDCVDMLQEALDALSSRSPIARDLIKAIAQWNVFNGKTLVIVTGNGLNCDCPMCKMMSEKNAYSFSENVLFYAPAEVARLKEEYMRVMPIEIAMAHELIHAWHHCTGVFLGSDILMEEMQTIGLGVFTEDKYTENNIRRDYGITLRPKY